MSIQATDADPLVAQPRADRLSYATGMLLDAQDFSDEQTYHRGRLARAIGFVAGAGTLAREIEAQRGLPDQVLVSVGGGGLVSGLAAWFAGR